MKQDETGLVMGHGWITIRIQNDSTPPPLPLKPCIKYTVAGDRHSDTEIKCIANLCNTVSTFERIMIIAKIHTDYTMHSTSIHEHIYIIQHIYTVSINIVEVHQKCQQER